MHGTGVSGVGPVLALRGSMLKRLLRNQAPEWNIRLQVQFLFPR